MRDVNREVPSHQSRSVLFPPDQKEDLLLYRICIQFPEIESPVIFQGKAIALSQDAKVSPKEIRPSPDPRDWSHSVAINVTWQGGAARLRLSNYDKPGRFYIPDEIARIFAGFVMEKADSVEKLIERDSD